MHRVDDHALLVALLGCARPPLCTHAADRFACEDGTSCARHSDCASGACSGGTCIESCRTDPCPATRICMTAGAGQPVTCGATCPEGFSYVGPHDGRICALGAVVACSDLQVPDGFCDACGCPAADHCFAPASAACDGTNCHCAAPAPLHAPCARASDCASGNCDPDLGCQLEAGAACTPGDGSCAYCDPASPAPVCRQECSDDGDCTDGFCIERNGRHAACYPDCGASSAVCTAEERCTTPDASGRRYCVPR